MSTAEQMAAERLAYLTGLVQGGFGSLREDIEKVDGRLEELADDFASLRRSIDLEQAHNLQDGAGI